jgi:hypothetical protein
VKTLEPLARGQGIFLNLGIAAAFDLDESAAALVVSDYDWFVGHLISPIDIFAG